MTRNFGFFVCLLSIGALTSCGQDGPPPDMTVVTEVDAEEGAQGSWCSGGMCAEAPGDGGTLVTAPSGRTGIEFEWPWEGDGELFLCRLENDAGGNCVDATTRQMVLPGTWDVKLKPGVYELSAFGTWEGGDASYDWRLRVNN